MIFMPFIYRNCDIVTLSKSCVKDIIKYKLSKKKIEIVNPGIEFAKFKKIQKDKYPLILFLNRIKKYKGLKTLLDAASMLEKDMKKIKIKIAGKGDYLSEIKDYSKSIGLKNIEFLGKVSEKNKKKLMQQAWVFINPSSMEGWGIVNIESNYYGTPVIGSDVSGIKDSIVNNKTGLLFKHGNSEDLARKIKTLLHNNSMRKKMGKKAIKWAKKFSWDKKSNEYLKILTKLTNKN